MNQAEALHMLESQPQEFLRKNSFNSVDLGGDAKIGTFYMTDKIHEISRPGKFLGNLNRKTGQEFHAQKLPIFGGLAFSAVNIPTKPSNLAIREIHTN